MSFAGIIATSLFIVTLLTVLSAIAAYGIFKARDLRRGRVPAPSEADVPLEYFVEFHLPGPAIGGAATDRGLRPVEEPARRRLYMAGAGAAAAVSLAGALFFSLRTPPPRPVPARPADDGGAVREPPPLTPVWAQKASLFPFASLDANHDGRIQKAERAAIHKQIPQFVFVTSDDNGNWEGIEWLREELRGRDMWSHVTFFLTGNYLPGRPNYMGGPIERSWQAVLDEGLIGLHGLTHAEGAEIWDAERWTVEHSTVESEITKHLKLPRGWDWSRYPFGSRAPFLILTDAYFQALERLPYKVLYDSSLLVQPGGWRELPPRDPRVRDVVWPFPLTAPLPDDVNPPYVQQSEARAKIGSHAIWEVPVYAYWIKPPGGKAQWQPSLDYNLWRFFGCNGAGPNEDIVNAVMDNLSAHFEGNRAPFHLGFHASSFGPDETCRRATAERLFDRLDAFSNAHTDVQYVSVAELLEWMAEHR